MNGKPGPTFSALPFATLGDDFACRECRGNRTLGGSGHCKGHGLLGAALSAPNALLMYLVHSLFDSRTA